MFCHRLIEFAKTLGAERVYTFAALATQMHPEGPSRVFVAATDTESLGELKRLDLETLGDGHIGGLNGVILSVAAEGGLRGACPLGEMPHIFAQLPFPKASLAVLEAFATIADIKIDFTELAEQARNMEQKLGELLAQMQQAIEQQMPVEEEESVQQVPLEQEGLSPDDQSLVEQLFEQAKHDRTSAYELKRQLDRLGVFQKYEDRFLDLFKKKSE